MARNNGRWGRLRRVLNEDLSTSTAVYPGADIDRSPGDTPRYGAGANIENHPQVTDYIPRRRRITSVILLTGVALGLVAELVAHYAEPLSTALGVPAADLTDALANRLIDWTTAIALVAAAGYARIVFLLKRHRLDDLRGRYRVWRQAGWLAIALSATIVTSAHQVGAAAVGHLLNVHPLGNDSLWWLLPAGAIGGWVMARLLADSAECRLAFTSFLIAALAFSGAAVGATLWSPAGGLFSSEPLSRVLPLVGCLAALAGTLLTARYVVLDVQGLIEHPVTEITAITVAHANTTATVSGSADEPVTAWTDGSELEDDDYDDRPLTKAERKRLRKQHGRYRAA